jgi:hypothetical protein
MKTQSSRTFSNDALPAPRATAAVEGRGPVVLTDAELALIAAAGSKPGASPGAGTGVRPPRVQN